MDYVQRMIDEYSELEIKVAALSNFVRSNDRFQWLLRCEQEPMEEQLELMEKYLRVLARRIRFAIED